MKKVEKTYTTTMYVAEDGKEYYTENECRAHDEYLLRCSVEREYERYFDLHSFDRWDGETDSLAQFVGLGSCYTLYLIEVDDIVLEVCDYVGLNGMEKYEGKKVFLSCEGFWKNSDWYFEGTLNQVLGDLKKQVRQLEELQMK